MLTIQNLKHAQGEPRVQDLCLAAALGFDRPRDVRKLIERNSPELLAYSGLCATVARTSGRPATEYWLTEPQALLVCMFARTDNAAAVRRQVIDVFMAWRRGGATVPRLPARMVIDPIGDIEVALETLRALVRRRGWIVNIEARPGWATTHCASILLA